jgi:hypothetical protein
MISTGPPNSLQMRVTENTLPPMHQTYRRQLVSPKLCLAVASEPRLFGDYLKVPTSKATSAKCFQAHRQPLSPSFSHPPMAQKQSEVAGGGAAPLATLKSTPTTMSGPPRTSVG